MEHTGQPVQLVLVNGICFCIMGCKCYEIYIVGRFIAWVIMPMQPFKIILCCFVFANVVEKADKFNFMLAIDLLQFYKQRRVCLKNLRIKEKWAFIILL